MHAVRECQRWIKVKLMMHAVRLRIDNDKGLQKPVGLALQSCLTSLYISDCLLAKDHGVTMTD